jgi:hypothetical protein
MIHVRHAAAAIAVGEPVRDGIDHAWRERPLRRRADPRCRRADESRRPIRAALWADGAADFVHDPVLRYMKTYGLTHEQLAMVSVVQREWAAKMRLTGFCGRSRHPRPRPGSMCRRRRSPGNTEAAGTGRRSSASSASSTVIGRLEGGTRDPHIRSNCRAWRAGSNG